MSGTLRVGFGQGPATLVAAHGFYGTQSAGAALTGVFPAPPPPFSTSGVKYINGDYAMTIKYQQGSPQTQINSDLAALASHPIPSGTNYVFGAGWTQLETGSTNNNLVSDAVNGVGQYGGFPALEAKLNSVWAAFPTANIGLVIVINSYGGTFTAAKITTLNWSTQGIIPPYIANCGGTLRTYASLGSSTFTDNPMASIYSGSAYYGLAFNGWSGGTYPTLSEAVPMFWSPGVNQQLRTLAQALSLYVLQSGPFAGQTLDQCSQFKFFLSNDEYSYAMLAGYNPKDSGTNLTVTVNPVRYVGAADQPTKANAIASYKAICQAWRTYFPRTPYLTNFSFGFGAGSGASDTKPDVAGYINNHISGSGLSAIAGLGFSCADTYGSDWTGAAAASVAWYADAGKQGFVGIASPVNGTTGPGTITNTTLTGEAFRVAQWQPTDYAARLPTGVAAQSQAAAGALIASSNNTYINAEARVMCMGDGATFGTTAWTTYVQPRLVAGVTPFNPNLPTNAMSPPGSLVVVRNSPTQLTGTWSAQGGVTFIVYIDGVQVATTASTTYAATVATGSHVYGVAMTNANGTGPLATQTVP